MLIFVIDTCLAVCQAALVRDSESLAAISEPMARGHQERLAPMAREVMAAAGGRFSEVDRIAVTVGPGSFTGLRVGLAFAKGLSLALQRPCVGVGTLAALGASVERAGPHAAAIDAGRGGVYLQTFEGEDEASAPDVMPLASAVARLSRMGTGCLLVGPQASQLAASAPGVVALDAAAPSPLAIARLARAAPVAPPLPLYLRAPDAKVSARALGQ